MDDIIYDDILTMRSIFDGLAINRPKHGFRWSVGQSRWEMFSVEPADRTLIAYLSGGEWVEL